MGIEEDDSLPKDELLQFVQDCIAKGREYRDKFRAVWDEIEGQIRQDQPSEWENKEAWQTKIFLPLQANASETIFAKFKKLLFSGQVFDATGHDKKDIERVATLVSLMSILYSDSGFEPENNNVLREGIDLGAGFLKQLARVDKKGLIHTWRSIYNCFFDPTCGLDFGKAKWWIDEYTKDLGEIIADIKSGKSLYDKDVVQKLIDENATIGTPGPKSVNDMAAVKSVDATTDIRQPEAYKPITLHEFWGLVKIPNKKEGEMGNWVETNDYVMEWRVITIANEKYILRNDKNEYGGIPAVMLNIRRRKYDTYGRGFLEKGRGLQDLNNSMINLGFDSQKIASMDISVVDVNAIADWDSIEYRPIAVWRVNDINGVKLPQRVGVSALMDILRGVGFIDQMHQDATSSTRQAQGSMPLLGQKGADTLGEYKLKLAGVDEKFIAEAKEIEATYLKPLIAKSYQIIINPELFDQSAADELLGVDTEIKHEPLIDPLTGESVIDPLTGEPATSRTENKTSKLKLSELSGDINIDFKLLGVTQLQEALGLIEQINGLLTTTGQFPMFAQYLNPYPILKKIIQILRIPDSDDFLKSPEQVQMEQSQVLTQQIRGGQQQPPMGG